MTTYQIFRKNPRHARDIWSSEVFDTKNCVSSPFSRPHTSIAVCGGREQGATESLVAFLFYFILFYSGCWVLRILTPLFYYHVLCSASSRKQKVTMGKRHRFIHSLLNARQVSGSLCWVLMGLGRVCCFLHGRNFSEPHNREGKQRQLFNHLCFRVEWGGGLYLQSLVSVCVCLYEYLDRRAK